MMAREILNAYSPPSFTCTRVNRGSEPSVEDFKHSILEYNEDILMRIQRKIIVDLSINWSYRKPPTLGEQFSEFWLGKLRYLPVPCLPASLTCLSSDLHLFSHMPHACAIAPSDRASLHLRRRYPAARTAVQSHVSLHVSFTVRIRFSTLLVLVHKI